MQNHLQRSGNTYVQFSFEKSLRKYEKPPHKKTKLNCSRYQNNKFCQQSVMKFPSRHHTPSVERRLHVYRSQENYMLNRHSNCKLQYIDKIDSDFSRKKQSLKISKQNQNSAFSTERNPQRIISNFQNSRNTSSIWQNHKKQANGQNESLNKFQLSIEKQSHRYSHFYEKLKKQSILKPSLRIDQQRQQDETFSQISIVDSSKKLNENSKKQNVKKAQDHYIQPSKDQVIERMQEQEAADEDKAGSSKIQSAEPQQNQLSDIAYPIISFAYFSSVSSLGQIQEENRDPNDLMKGTMLDQKAESNINMQMLRLQSRQELKKENIREFRERKFYQVKKIKQLSCNAQKCHELSQNLKTELSSLQQKHQQSQQQFSLFQNNVQFKQKTVSNPKDQKGQYEGQDQEIYVQQTQKNSFKRDRPCSSSPGKIIIRKRERQNNLFERQDNIQNNKFLGRIKIPITGATREQFCLSMRSFKKLLRSNENSRETVNSLIKKRSYLQNNRQELIQIIQNLKANIQ